MVLLSGETFQLFDAVVVHSWTDATIHDWEKKKSKTPSHMCVYVCFERVGRVQSSTWAIFRVAGWSP